MAMADREPRADGGSGDSGGHGGSGDSGGHGGSGDSGGHGGSGIWPPPKSFLAARQPGNTQSGPAETKVNWAEPAETTASWTRPTLGGAPKAPIL